MDPHKNVEYGARFLKSLYKRKGNNWIKAATAYHSSVPKKAKVYKKKLVNTYASIKQALNNSRNTFRKTEQKTVKTLATKHAYDKNKLIIEQKIATKANAWRQSKLQEYRNSKVSN